MIENFKVGNLVAEPGEKIQGYLEVVNSHVKMPATLICGSKPGKTVAITGGIHGGEYPGVETAIRLARQIEPNNVSGRIVILHPANIPAFEAKMQYFGPDDGKNLNRMFPGRALGTISEKIAYTITTELHDQADFYMDLHGGDIHEDLVPFVIYPTGASDEVVRISKEAASVLGISYVVGSVSTNGTFGSAAERGVPGFLGEIGKCGLWSEDEVEDYLRGVKNVLRYLEVLPGEVEDLGTVTYMPKMHGVTAEQTGCWYPSIKPGDPLKEGQKVGEIRDYFGKTLEEYYSPVNGTTLYVISSLAITQGDPLVAIG